MLKYYAHRKENTINIHNIVESTIVDDVPRTIPRIYAALKECQVNHQSSMVEVEGEIVEQFISIFN